MKAFVIGSAVAALAAGVAFAQEPATPAATTPTAPAQKMVCLWTNRIDRTKAVDPTTLLFYMKDGKVWENRLKTRCPNLKNFGYSFITPDGKICSNGQIIYVLKTGDACMMGDFVPYTPPPKEPAAPHTP